MSEFAPIEEMARLMDGFPGPWFIAGGWAIDLFLGTVTREHEDREVMIFREDQQALRQHLAGWRMTKSISTPEGGAWVPWPEDEWIAAPSFQVQAWGPEGDVPAWEFFLNDQTGGVWHFRRNPAVTRPVAELGLRTPGGIPYIAPELQLLYKAHGHRPKDELDFEHVHPRLSRAQRAWLREMLGRCRPDDPWLARLGDT